MRSLKRVYLAIMIIFMYAPIIVLIVYSFNASKSRAAWGGFTLNWYAQLFKDPKILSALYTTLSVAVISALIAAVLGTAAAVGIDSLKGSSKRIMMVVTNIPVVNPDIVMGVSLMILFIFLFKIFSFLNLQFGYVTLLLAHVSFNVPYVILSVLPKLRQMDGHLFEAAQDLGASPFQGFFKVILPEI
ncbi:MAG: ABC transporter permease subunit, partial [Defluviitaleaceae bacterium]|nr:ABC transporter permease subunit [Defluviitaleaceae bacterium]